MEGSTTTTTKIQTVIVLGAGSAGLIAALTVKRKHPDLTVRIIRSPDIGVIGVGEGTTPRLPEHLFDYLGISRKQFYSVTRPTWKLGIRFIWGPRPYYDYGFDRQLDGHWADLPRPNGYYCDEEFRFCDLPTSLMEFGKAFARQPGGGGPDVQPWHGFHVENKKLVEALELFTLGSGVEIIDGKVAGVERASSAAGNGGDEPIVKAVVLEDGRRIEADFFIDASGFRSELLGRALEEPFMAYDRSLFCDRAVVGGWTRGEDEPVLPYTTAETMDAGWCWKIEHENFVNRGYVYCSGATSDDDARAEFLRKNPKAPTDGRVVKFRSGRYRRSWVGNVCAVGNASGFVEPLEASALMVVCIASRTLVEFFTHSGRTPTPTLRRLFNDTMNGTWDEIRDFLALHYKANTRLDTRFWRQCRAGTDTADLDPLLKLYEENGPVGFGRHLLRGTGTNYGIEGFLVHLVGMRVPYRSHHQASAAERATWDAHRTAFANAARDGMTVTEALSYVHHPGWRWHGDV